MPGLDDNEQRLGTDAFVEACQGDTLRVDEEMLVLTGFEARRVRRPDTVGGPDDPEISAVPPSAQVDAGQDRRSRRALPPDRGHGV